MFRQTLTLMLASITLIAPSFARAEERALRVVIDPGHGGNDAGAHRGAIKESEIALQIARDLKELLKNDSRFISLLTRESDKYLSLEQRTTFAEKNKADLLLSIHANASPDPRAQGAEFYFQNLLGADEESMFLASRENAAEASTVTSVSAEEAASSANKSDLSQILDDLKRNRKLEVSSALSHMFVDNWPQARLSVAHRSSMVRQAPFYVVSQTTMPAVLVEVGFVSHSEESAAIASRARQKEIARQLYEALIQFKAKSDSDEL